jgi:hypothetical protein
LGARPAVGNAIEHADDDLLVVISGCARQHTIALAGHALRLGQPRILGGPIGAAQRMRARPRSVGCSPAGEADE